MSNPRPDPPRLAAIREHAGRVRALPQGEIAANIKDDGASGLSDAETVIRSLAADALWLADGVGLFLALLSDLRTLEAQWRARSDAQRKLAPEEHDGVVRVVYESQALVLKQVADDLDSLLARLEGT